MGKRLGKSVVAGFIGALSFYGAVALYEVLDKKISTTPSEFVEDSGSGSIEAVLPDDGDEEAFFYGEHFDADERGDEVIITLDQRAARNI